MDGDGGQCAVRCKRGFTSSTASGFGEFSCDLGKLTGPGLDCTPITCDSTKLQISNSKLTDGLTDATLKFEEKVSFACKEGYQIEDQTFDPSVDEMTCDRNWNPTFSPQHNNQCKVKV